MNPHFHAPLDFRDRRAALREKDMTDDERQRILREYEDRQEFDRQQPSRVISILDGHLGLVLENEKLKVRIADLEAELTRTNDRGDLAEEKYVRCLERQVNLEISTRCPNCTSGVGGKKYTCTYEDCGPESRWVKCDRCGGTGKL